MSQGALNPKIRFLGQKVCSVAHIQTDRHTDKHARKWIQRALFQGFRIFSSRIGPIEPSCWMEKKQNAYHGIVASPVFEDILSKTG